MISYVWEREIPVQVEDCGDLWRIKDGQREWMCNCQYDDWATIALGLTLVDTQRGFEIYKATPPGTWRTS